MTKGKTSFPKVLYDGRREMMPQRMIILKHRRNRAGRHKTGCPSLRTRYVGGKHIIWKNFVAVFQDFRGMNSVFSVENNCKNCNVEALL